MKSTSYMVKSPQEAYKDEEMASVCRSIQLAMSVLIDEINAPESARQLNMSRSRGAKWAKRYGEVGLARIRDRARSGKPPKAHPGIMKKVRGTAQGAMCRTVDGMRILRNARVVCSVSHARSIMKVGLRHGGAPGTARQPGLQEARTPAPEVIEA